MSKIGIGDKVRVVRGWDFEICKGRIGTCVSTDGGCASYDFGPGFAGWSHKDGPETCWYVHSEDLELVEKHVIGVGDRVRLTEVNDLVSWGDKGDTGTVVDVKIPWRPYVRFDRLGQHWYVNADKLEVIEIAPAMRAPAATPAKPEPKFKAGDRVRCLESSWRSFIKDKLYEVGGHYQEAYVERGDNEKVGIVANERGVADGWGVEYFELVVAEPATAAPLTAVLVGQKLRVGHDGAPYIDKGAIVEVLDIKVVYKDRDGDEVSASISNFVAISDEELAGMDRDAQREETLARLRDTFTPKQYSPAFAIGDAVIVDDSTVTNKIGLVIGGPDSAGDYQVGVFENNNTPADWYYSPEQLKAA